MYWLLLLPVWTSILVGTTHSTVNTPTPRHPKRIVIPKFSTQTLSNTLIRDKNTGDTENTWRQVSLLLAHGDIDLNSYPINNRNPHPLSLATSPPYDKYPSITLMLLEHGAHPTMCEQPTTDAPTSSTLKLLKGAQKIHALLSSSTYHNKCLHNYLTHQPFSDKIAGSLAYLRSQTQLVKHNNPFLLSLRWSNFLYKNKYLLQDDSSTPTSEKELEGNKKKFYARWHHTLCTCSSLHTTLRNRQKQGTFRDITIQTKR